MKCKGLLHYFGILCVIIAISLCMQLTEFLYVNAYVKNAVLFPVKCIILFENILHDLVQVDEYKYLLYYKDIATNLLATFGNSMIVAICVSIIVYFIPMLKKIFRYAVYAAIEVDCKLTSWTTDSDVYPLRRYFQTQLFGTNPYRPRSIHYKMLNFISCIQRAQVPVLSKDVLGEIYRRT